MREFTDIARPEGLQLDAQPGRGIGEQHAAAGEFGEHERLFLADMLAQPGSGEQAQGHAQEAVIAGRDAGDERA